MMRMFRANAKNIFGQLRSQKPRWIGGLASKTSAEPVVADQLINVTLLDFEGHRHYIKGRIGQNLREACVMNGLDLIKDDSNGGGGTYSAIRTPTFTESLFGEGMPSPQSHVIVVNEWFDKLPPPSDNEKEVLDLYLSEDDLTATSRLATEIKLSKDLDGIMVVVPEAPPVETYEYSVDEVEDDDDDEEEQMEQKF